ncbi:unnamed protein product, partial [Amoebophrya sp. A25]
KPPSPFQEWLRKEVGGTHGSSWIKQQRPFTWAANFQQMLIDESLKERTLFPTGSIYPRCRGRYTGGFSNFAAWAKNAARQALETLQIVQRDTRALFDPYRKALEIEIPKEIEKKLKEVKARVRELEVGQAQKPDLEDSTTKRRKDPLALAKEAQQSIQKDQDHFR